MNPLKQYALVTANYWAFTITDGAIRMLVLLFFYELGYTPLEIALLFLFYEFFGIVTNLVGGWLGAKIGLKVTMNAGLVLQIFALLMLIVDPVWLSVTYVMVAQAISGIAKDLNKMSAKSSIKQLASDGNDDNTLYKWVAVLTGSKNTLKGVGFFVGAGLLTWVGFTNAMFILAGLLVVPLIPSILFLDNRIGKAKHKPKFREVFSQSRSINLLSGARFFLFGARDIWFVVALPVFLASTLHWEHLDIGTFMALWVIGYGIIQAITPQLTKLKNSNKPTTKTAELWAYALAIIPLLMALTLYIDSQWVLLIGLSLFGILFAINSAIHSYLIVSFADSDGTSKDVGFYYMANAAGRLAGTILSGYVYQAAGMQTCLIISSGMIAIAALIARKTQHKPK